MSKTFDLIKGALLFFFSCFCKGVGKYDKLLTRKKRQMLEKRFDEPCSKTLFGYKTCHLLSLKGL